MAAAGCTEPSLYADDIAFTARDAPALPRRGRHANGHAVLIRGRRRPYAGLPAPEVESLRRPRARTPRCAAEPGATPDPARMTGFRADGRSNSIAWNAT